MSQDFKRRNLQGQSFQSKDLAGADFSEADLRGTDFTGAKLTGANFSQAKLGVGYTWLVILTLSLLLLALLGGIVSGYAGASLARPLASEAITPTMYILARFYILGLLLSFVVITLLQGIGADLGTFITLVAVITGLVVVIPGSSSGRIEFIILPLIIAIAIAGVIILAIAIAIARIIAGKVGIVAAGALIGIGSLGGILSGFEAVEGGLFSGEIIGRILLIAVPFASVLAALSIYIGWQAIAGDKKYDLIRGAAIALCSWRGTSFRRANLTDADFTQAIIKSADLRGEILTRTNWFQAKCLDHARLDGTVLEDARIRQLVTTKQGRDRNFDYLDLRGLNLEGANLADASFIGTKLSEANLANADLSRAKLVQAQLYGADLTGACLTGAIIQDWSISTDTKFEGVKCEYIYMQLPTKNDPDPCRKPDNRNEVFQDGDFADFIAPIIKTMDLYRTQNVDLRNVARNFKSIDLFHHEGLDPTAAAIALKQLAEQHPEAGLEVVALEGRGEDKVRVQARVTGNADRSALSAEYFKRYEQISSLPYADMQSLLTGIAEKDERIRSLEQMVYTAMDSKKFYVETYYQMGDTVSEKSSSINISAGGNIGNVSGIAGGDISGVINLGTISGSVTNAINQIPDTPKDSEEPSLKELLLQLQAAIEAEAALTPEDKAEALEQVQTLAEAGQAPEDGATKKAAKTAMKVLKGTIASLPSVTQLVEATTKLLPLVTKILGIG